MSAPKVIDCIMVYHSHHKNKTWKTCKAEWLECDDEAKRKAIITEAINSAKKVLNEENVEEVLKKKFKIYEIQQYLQYKVGLVVPPLKPHFLYGQEELSDFPPLKWVAPRIDCATSVKFCSLDFEIQMKYTKKYYDLWLEFNKKLSEWRNLENRDFFDEALDKMGYSFKKDFVIKYKKIPTRMGRKHFVEVCMPYTKQNFPDEPEPRLITVTSLLEIILNNGQKMDLDKVKNVLENIHFMARKGLEDQVFAYRTEYKSVLLKYVYGLTEEKRKIFLGFRRKPIYMKMMEDVFNKDYPSEKYPVYLLEKIAERHLKRNTEKEPNLDSNRGMVLPEDFDPIQVIYDSLDSLRTWGYNLDSSDSDS